MDFGLSQDQQMLRDAVARCLADTCPLDHVRECAERDNPLSDKVLRAVQDLGIPGMLVPEEHGGLGMTLLDAAIVAEQLAYAVAPVPFLASHVLAPIALSEAGSEGAKGPMAAEDRERRGAYRCRDFRDDRGARRGGRFLC